MSERIAEFAVERMEGSPAVVSCLRMASGYANSNYRLETSAGIFLLRHRIGPDQSEVTYELDVLDWLRSHRFPAPAALHFGCGERWLAGPGDSHVVLLEWLEGTEPESNESTVAAIACALGDLHRLPPPSGDWWQRENPVGEGAVTRLVELVTANGAPHEQATIFVEEYELLRDQLGTPLPRGLIHGDVFPDNTLFRDHELVAILDFEAACEDVLLFDVAMTIHGFCFPGEKWSPQLADALVRGYSERRPLSDEEWDALPIYLRWCSLTMMGWHLEELLRRPNADNERRAADFGRRIITMRDAAWPAAPAGGP